jgi:hypothetical protein
MTQPWDRFDCYEDQSLATWLDAEKLHDAVVWRLSLYSHVRMSLHFYGDDAARVSFSALQRANQQVRHLFTPNSGAHFPTHVEMREDMECAVEMDRFSFAFLRLYAPYIGSDLWKKIETHLLQLRMHGGRLGKPIASAFERLVPGARWVDRMKTTASVPYVHALRIVGSRNKQANIFQGRVTIFPQHVRGVVFDTICKTVFEPHRHRAPSWDWVPPVFLKRMEDLNESLVPEQPTYDDLLEYFDPDELQTPPPSPPSVDDDEDMDDGDSEEQGSWSVHENRYPPGMNEYISEQSLVLLWAHHDRSAGLTRKFLNGLAQTELSVSLADDHPLMKGVQQGPDVSVGDIEDLNDLPPCLHRLWHLDAYKYEERQLMASLLISAGVHPQAVYQRVRTVNERRYVAARKNASTIRANTKTWEKTVQFYSRNRTRPPRAGRSCGRLQVAGLCPSSQEQCAASCRRESIRGPLDVVWAHRDLDGLEPVGGSDEGQSSDDGGPRMMLVEEDSVLMEDEEEEQTL